MSRIAILLGANPKSARHGPEAYLREGLWEIVMEGVEDSELSLHHGLGSVTKLNGAKVVVTGPTTVIAEFTHQGTERFIHLFADAV